MYTLIQNTSSLTLASMCYTSHTSTEPILSIITYKTSDGKLCPTTLTETINIGQEHPLHGQTTNTARHTHHGQKNHVKTTCDRSHPHPKLISLM